MSWIPNFGQCGVAISLFSIALWFEEIWDSGGGDDNGDGGREQGYIKVS